MTYNLVPRLIHSPKESHCQNSVVVTQAQKHTHANEKLSTFCTAATGDPFIVIFVKGVLCSVSFPYQSIARTEA